MDLPSLLLILALALPIGFYVLRPLLAPGPSRDGSAPSGEGSRLSALLAERERVLAALQELDFDYAAEKIPEEEYPARRAALVAEGAAVLKALDEAAKNAGKATEDEAGEPPEAGGLADREAVLENLVASLRRVPANGRPPAMYCSQCGKLAQAGDRYCSRCGHPVAAAVERE